MTIVQDVADFYAKKCISALHFNCVHLDKCKANSPKFTTAREAFIGRAYEHRSPSVPRLLFISLDPGTSDADPRLRTVEELRRSADNECHVLRGHFPKGRHWFETHAIAIALLKQFDPQITLDNVHNFFVHTNSAKCCQDKEGNAAADWRLFDNCREFIPGELCALAPDVVVTQGNPALWAVQTTCKADILGNLKAGGHGLLHLDGRIALWLHMYHPRAYGYYYRQKSGAIQGWPMILSRFLRQED